jgi:hypothetical protein
MRRGSLAVSRLASGRPRRGAASRHGCGSISERVSRQVSSSSVRQTMAEADEGSPAMLAALAIACQSLRLGSSR